jgi:membrane-bound serine protease (ClpP class)
MRSIVLALVLLASTGRSAAQEVHVLPYDGAITPVSAEYFTEGIAAAEAENAAAVILEIDTPGGLDSAMRAIVKAELNARIPVVVYVAPPGSRAASAGAYITMAAHVAAMAPGTNIGSATPVSLGGAAMDSTMTRKVVHDATAYLESIARQRGRNVELARRMVEDAENLSADDALAQDIVDLLADDRRDLLDQLDGMRVEVGADTVRLDTADARLIERGLTARQKLLKTLVDPNVAYILFLLGIYGLFFELANPGSLAPGILGAICIILALFAFQGLPTNYAGMGLILAGVVMLLLEVKVTSFGALTIGGIAAMVLGSTILFDTPGDWAKLSLKVILPVVLVTAGFFVLCVWLVVRSQKRRVVTGHRALVGEFGRVVEAIAAGGRGKVVFHGEIWTATSDESLEHDDRIEVVEIEDRLARVKRATPEGG